MYYRYKFSSHMSHVEVILRSSPNNLLKFKVKKNKFVLLYRSRSRSVFTQGWWTFLLHIFMIYVLNSVNSVKILYQIPVSYFQEEKNNIYFFFLTTRLYLYCMCNICIKVFQFNSEKCILHDLFFIRCHLLVWGSVWGGCHTEPEPD